MPKAKYKRKGAPLSLLKVLDSENNVNEKPNISKVLLNEILASSKCSESCENELNILSGSEGSILRLPEEMMCMILQHLPMAAIARMEQTCKHLRTIIIHARIWRKILLTKIEFEPELKAFLPDFSCLEKQEKDNYDSEIDSLSYKRLLENLKLKLDYTWMSAHSPNISRTNHVFGELEEEHFLYHIISTGRHFLSFWGPMKTDTKTQRDYIIDVFDRTTLTKVKRLTDLHGKPDIVRVVSEIGLVLLSYPGLLMVELVMIDKTCHEEEDGGGREYLDLARGEPETGSICDIAVRDHVTLRGSLHRRVVLVAMNTEPLDNRHFHIGQIVMFSLDSGGQISPPQWSIEFRPVPLSEGQGRFFNQCIQKKGLCDFNDSHVVVVVGGCEGSAVLAVVDLPTTRVIHKLQLRGEGGVGVQDMESGCEGGACQYSVVSLMIDKLHTELCAVLLSTGQLNVIHLPSGNTLFHRHLQFDGQLKLALHQPRFLGTQRIAIKFRNFVAFYDLSLSSVQSEIGLNHVRTLRITSVDGRETRLDDNPSQELRRQFGELQKRVRALNNYTSGIQKKLDKGLRPGTVTQGVLSMTRKVQLVTSKLDQAHGKAREIEAIVIASIAFDNRFCHALTLNRDLVVFDLLGALETYTMERRDSVSGGSSKGRMTRARTRE
eukprot:TRINITY_DN29800_c0_g1_i1.p1 TRINITY_DN29800_c0_g1~~TRINITY_DN29800_c0_g1_i1.p1  ORF type:complete len:700 (-),score=207.27 TRINITY_DN29800_c0_g1_i1:116-2101(-)